VKRAAVWLELGLRGAFRTLFSLYPASVRTEYAEEMDAVHAQVLAMAARRGNLALLAAGWNELGSLPGVILRLHLDRLQRQAKRLRAEAPGWVRAQFTALPPPERDGRSAWRLALLEILFFVGWGGLLLGQGYGSGRLPGPGSPAYSAGLAVSGGLLLVGLWFGLPRWSLPPLGLVLGYGALAAGGQSMLGMYLAWLAGVAALLLVGLRLDLRTRSAVDARAMRIAISLVGDVRRAAFAFYGLLPLLLLVAYDHSYLPGSTPALAVSGLGMVLGALAYSRSRSPWAQAGALAGGVALALGAAFLEFAVLGGSLWIRHLGWMALLGGGALALVLAPFLFGQWLDKADLHFPTGVSDHE
jgi:hypothetical protein